MDHGEECPGRYFGRSSGCVDRGHRAHRTGLTTDAGAGAEANYVGKTPQRTVLTIQARLCESPA